MTRSLLASSFLLFSFACVPDDVKDTGPVSEEADADTDADTDADSDADTDADTDADPAAIQGAWLSEGADLAPFFVDNNITSASVTFGGDGSYTGETVFNGTPIAFSGTYTVDVSTTPHTIVVNQVSPQELTSEGIWQVSGSTMTYEIVQTSPDQGFVAPTPESGFGSSEGGGVAAGDLTQTYQKQ